MKRLGLLIALVVALAAAGCGGGEDESATPETVEGTPPTDTSGGGAGGGEQGDATAGKGVFAKAGCGSCHTYSKAGSNGSVGPNLDDADVDYDAAVEQVTNGGGGMPPFKDQLSEKEIADVAAFVTQD